MQITCTGRNTYDANGRVIEQVQADGGKWTFAYTLLNPQAPTSPVLETTVSDPLGRPATYRFNPQGFLADVTDALGQTRIFEREAGTNLLLSVKGTASCNVCGASGAGDQSFTYDADGNRLTTTDALGNTTTFTYEPVFNKVASIIDPTGQITQFAYGASGNLSTVTDANTNATSLTYDSFGLVTEIVDQLGEQSLLTYDSFGNPVVTTDSLGNTTSIRRIRSFCREPVEFCLAGLQARVEAQGEVEGVQNPLVEGGQGTQLVEELAAQADGVEREALKRG